MSANKTERILSRDLSRLPPAAAGDPFNFINAVLDFLTRWCSTYNLPVQLADEAYCCFVGFERVSEAVSKAGAFVLCPFFREDTPQDLLGKVYFASDTCSAVYGREVPMKNLGHCDAQLKKLEVADRPVVIFNAADRKVLWRVDPTAEMRQVVLQPQPAPRITSAEFDQTLTDFHKEYTETPQGLTKPWQSAPKLLTKADLEEEIRDDLFVYLRFMMQEQFGVFRESFGAAGRADLLVYFHAEREVFYVELKVLRGYTKRRNSRARVSNARIIAWGRAGIAQAFNYKQSNRRVGTAYACCFDAREGNNEIQELNDFAVELNVEYRRFFMYSSAALLHDTVAGQ